MSSSEESIYLVVVSVVRAPVCNRLLNFREDSMVIDVGEPADWVKINVRQTVSFTKIISFNHMVHKYYRVQTIF